MKTTKAERLEQLRFVWRLLDRIDELMEALVVANRERDEAVHRLAAIRVLLTANEGPTQILAIIDGV